MQAQRRQFIIAGAVFGVTGIATGLMSQVATKEPAAGSPGPAKKKEEAAAEEEVSPLEDLMREHGALRRILLIYGEALRRLAADQDLSPKAITDTAGIVRSFVEDYHEKLEEDYLFPRFKKAHKLPELVEVLADQHHAGRRLTDVTMRLSTAQSLKNAEDRKALTDSLHLFIRMYGPHAAREDTVLFPAMRPLFSPGEYDRLGDEFEKKEQQLFGADGFEMMVDRIASIEKSLGIYDLSQFTPRE